MQVSPRIWNVAVPLPQHSAMFGQRASSQTVLQARAVDQLLDVEVAAVGARRAHLHPLGAAWALGDGKRGLHGRQCTAGTRTPARDRAELGHLVTTFVVGPFGLALKHFFRNTCFDAGRRRPPPRPARTAGSRPSRSASRSSSGSRRRGSGRRPSSATPSGSAPRPRPTTCALLARFGLVEDAGGGAGRNRPWRSVGTGFMFEPPSTSRPRRRRRRSCSRRQLVAPRRAGDARLRRARRGP